MMIRKGSLRKLTQPDEVEQQAKDLKRMLAKAEQKVRRLQDRVADQHRQLRELHSQAKQEQNLVAECETLKAEVAELRGETRELTRANREHVAKYETLRVENEKLLAEAKARKSNAVRVGAPRQRTMEPV